VCVRRGEALHFIRQRVESNGAVGEANGPVFLLPRHRVLQPIRVVALLVVFARVRTARFRPGAGGVGDDHGLIGEIEELERGDECHVPLQRRLIDGDVRHRLAQSHQLVQPRLQRVGAPEDAEARLHRLLHPWPDLAGLVAALALADSVEPPECAVFRPINMPHWGSRLDELRGAQRRRPSEDDEVEETVGAEAIGAVHRDARRLADRHQAWHDGFGIVLGRTDDLGPNVGWNASHHVMDGRNYRDRLLVRIDTGEDASRVDDSGQSMVEDIRGQMLKMKMDVILLLADAAAFADLDRFGAADDVAGGKVLLMWRIFGHEPLARAVGQIAAFAPSALGDQDAHAIDASRMELDEFHVLQRQGPRATPWRCHRRCRCGPMCKTGRPGRIRRSRSPSCWRETGGSNHPPGTRRGGRSKPRPQSEDRSQNIR